MIKSMCFLVFINVFFILQNSLAYDFKAIFSAPKVSLNKIKIIDARSRDRWLKSRLKNSVFFDWDHFSQPGAGSRGSLRINPQVTADDLANSGFSPSDTVYIYGYGSRGRGNEGRIAWMLYRLGFDKIHITDFKTAVSCSKGALESGPFMPTPVSKWTPKLREDLTLRFSEFKKWTSDKNKKYTLIALREQTHPKLPGVYSPTDLNIRWSFFVEQPDKIKAAIEEHLKRKNYDKDVPILPISFAGLSSAYVCLILRSWGFNALLVPEGYSIELD
jgi:3-mercaptopyruvate sulfurtransferase SseA